MATRYPIDALLAHADWVREFVHSLVFDESQVDDVVQQTWLAAIESAPESIETPKGWLGQVARRFVFQEGRRSKARRKHESNVVGRDADIAADEAVQRLELHRTLVDAIAALESSYRTVVVLRFFHGQKPQEIANQLGLPVTTVSNRLHRALEHLRAEFDRRFGKRVTWQLALLPLAVPRASVAGSLSASGLLASTCVVLLAGLAIWMIAHPGAPTEGEERQASSGVAAISESPNPDATPPLRIESSAFVDAAASKSDSPDQPPVAPRLLGRVIDGDGTPIPDATVALFRPRSEAFRYGEWFGGLDQDFLGEPPLLLTTSAGDGTFEIEAPEFGTYDIGVRSFGRGLFVKDRQKIDEPVKKVEDVVLQETQTAVCIVLDEERRPIPMARVSIHSNGLFDFGMQRCWTDRCVTGPDGTFEVDLLRAARAGLKLFHGGRVVSNPLWTRQRASIRAEGFVEIPLAFFIDRDVDEAGRIVFVLERGRRLDVRLTPGEGVTLPSALKLTLEVGRESRRVSITVDSSGVASIPSAPYGETVRAYLETPGFVLAPAHAMEGAALASPGARFTINDREAELLLATVLRGGTIDGIAVDEATGAPASGVKIVAWPSSGPINPTTLCRAESDASGRWRLEGVLPAWTEVRVLSNRYLASAVGGKDRWTELSELDAEASVFDERTLIRRLEPLELIVRTSSASPIAGVVLKVASMVSLTGKVVDASGNPLEGATVVLDGESIDNSRWPQLLRREADPERCVSNHDGEFSLSRVPSGRAVRLYATKAGLARAVSPPLTLSDELQREGVILVMAPGAPVTILVTDESGAPQPGIGVEVSIRNQGRRGSLGEDGTGKTNPDGRVTFTALPAGPAKLLIESRASDGFDLPRDFNPEFDVPKVEPLTMEVKLVRYRQIVGTVIDEDGATVINGSVIATPAEVTPADVERYLRVNVLESRGLDESALRRATSLWMAARTRLDDRGLFTFRVEGDRPYVVRRVEAQDPGNPRGARRSRRPLEDRILVPGAAGHTVIVGP